MAITSFVLVIAFSAIYLVAVNSANRRPPVMVNVGNFDENVSAIFEDRLKDERKESLNSQRRFMTAKSQTQPAKSSLLLFRSVSAEATSVRALSTLLWKTGQRETTR